MHKNAYLLLLATTLFWAGNTIAGKLAVGHVSPMLLNAARWSAMLAIMAVVGRRHILADRDTIRAQWPFLLFMGALGFTVFGVAMYTALVFTSATNVSIEQGGVPLFVFIASFLMFGTRTTVGQVVGFMLSFAGVAMTATNGDLRNLVHMEMNFGDMLMLLAIAAFGTYTAALTRKRAMHWMSLVAALCVGAVVAAVPLVILEGIAGSLIMPDAQGWAVIGYTIVFPSLLAQIFYLKAVEDIGANRAGIFVNLVPVWGVILSVAILREAFETHHAIALAMVLAGVLLAEYSGRRRADVTT